MFRQICLVSLPLGQYTVTPNVQPDLSGLTTSGAIHRSVWSHYLLGNTHPMFSKYVWSHYLWGNTQICLVSLPLGQYTPNVQPDLSGLIIRVQSPFRVPPKVGDVETVLLQTQAFRQQLPRPATHLFLCTRKQPFVTFIKFLWDPYICLQLFFTEISTSGYNYF